MRRKQRSLSADMYVVLLTAALLATLVSTRSVENPADSADNQHTKNTMAASETPGNARSLAVPPPVQVTSAVLTVKGNAREGRVIEIGDDGIPIIHGVRVPDDPSDTRIYRNARIVNNKLMTPEEEVKANQVEGRSINSPSKPSTSQVGLPDAAVTQLEESSVTDLLEPKTFQVEGKSVTDLSEPAASHRRARVLNEAKQPSFNTKTEGFKPSPRVVGASFSPVSSSLGSIPAHQQQYPDFYYKGYYDHDRVGVVAEASFEDDNVSTSSEQVVSYSYLAAPKDTSRAKDVVYGSGSAAEPPKQSLTLAAAPSSFQPIKTSSGLSSSLSIGVPYTQLSSPQSFAVHSDASNLDTTPREMYSSPSTAQPPVIISANPGQFVIKESTFQAHPGAPIFTVPIPVPSNQMASPVLKPVMTAGRRLSERLQLSERMSDFSDNLQLDSRNHYLSRNAEDGSLPLVAGATALAAIGLVGIAVAAANNITFAGKRSVDYYPLELLDQLVSEVPLGEPTLLHRLEDYAPWASSSCSRRILCRLMTYTSEDFLFSVEKRVDVFLGMFDRGDDQESSLKRAADDILSAARQRQCDVIKCNDQVLRKSRSR
ncbi:uncharacterized protein [Cherax quadricarinatus]|uniref:uncharacterized protein isoform X2 n=1 Tax=Cherax quadricarinatus TaxID=27406 RepID=UPI00387EBE54